MTIVTVDFETYWSDTYSLTRMSEVDYILSPLFQVIGVSIKVGDGPITWHAGHPGVIEDAFAEIDWENVALLSHNMRFDGSILKWRYGYEPKFYLDTLCMARAVTHAKLQSSSLASVAQGMGLPPKGDEVLRVKGKRLEAFTERELHDYGAYCAHDSFLCRTIFDRFMEARFPKSELEVIDHALRMFITPTAQLDMHKLAIHLHGLEVYREKLFSNVDRSNYTSNEKFARILMDAGVTPAQKISPTTGKWIWALSRNDPEFKRMCEDPELTHEQQVHLMIRRGAKSTIEETRTRRMLELAKLDWYLPSPKVSGGDQKGADYQGRGWMPVPYLYYGAHTGRFSGTAGFNFANLPRASPIREAIVAPPGMRIVHRDASQIECRVLAAISGCALLLRGFQKGEDVYCDFASRFYKRGISKTDTKERFTGKTAVLSLGYGAGWLRFQNTLFLGQGGMSVQLTSNEAAALVTLYRETYFEIPALWKKANGIIAGFAGQIIPNQNLELFPEIYLDYSRGNIRLPNGLRLQYPGITALQVPWANGEADDDDDAGTLRTEIRYQGARKGQVKKLYGAKLVENITQALARIIVTDVMRRVYYATGRRPFMGTYDSWDYVVDENEVEAFNEILAAEFIRPPTWLPNLPLASEGGWGRTLSEAEKGENL